MTTMIDISRRGFVAAAAATAGAFSLGMPLRSARAQGAAAPEVNAWVVVKPDDTVVVRIARSEMGKAR